MVIIQEGTLPPMVTIPQGMLKGELCTDIKGGKFYCFYGIPYAKPPVGDLRFKAPQPADPWCGLWDATKEKDTCYSLNKITKKPLGSEDCLFVNIFVKKSCQKSKPVMLWIHGGGFTEGSGNKSVCGANFLMLEHVVLVTINYRLGILGFLSLEDPSLGVPGNAGLKDQSMAIKWTHDNIEHFGGDPNNITIFGNSAGSASCHFHILSPMSKGLFHKAVLQSGSALNCWAYGKTSDSAQDVAKQLGYAKCGCDEKEILEVLMKASVEDLYAAQLKVERPFAPVIEKPNDTAFITRNVVEIIQSGDYNKVPMIIGYNTTEGAVYELAHPGRCDEDRMKTDTEIPWQVKVPPEVSKALCQKIKDFYFKDGFSLDKELAMHGDSLFLAGIMGAINNHVKTTDQPIFMYRMSLISGLNYLQNLIKTVKLPGAWHADEKGYIFQTAITPTIKPGSIEETALTWFVKLWTNFAKCGHPTPNQDELGVMWKQITEGKRHYLEIGKKLSMEPTPPEMERLGLWKEIFEASADTKNFM